MRAQLQQRYDRTKNDEEEEFDDENLPEGQFLTEAEKAMLLQSMDQEAEEEEEEEEVTEEEEMDVEADDDVARPEAVLEEIEANDDLAANDEKIEKVHLRRERLQRQTSESTVVDDEVEAAVEEEGDDDDVAPVIRRKVKHLLMLYCISHVTLR